MRLFKIFVLFLLLGSHLPGFAQSPEARNEAHQLSVKGLTAISEGEYPKAIECLVRARKLDDRNPQYGIQLANAYFLNKNYPECMTIVKPMMNRKRAVAEAWQLYGNCLDEQGKSYEALQIYRKGLKRFPNSGLLYHEMGILEYGRHNDERALQHWEDGIRMNPTFSANYYFAAKVHLDRGNYVWATAYAEMYLNLDRMGGRTREMSILMLKGYEKARWFDFQEAFKWRFFQVPDPASTASGAFLPIPDYALQLDEAYASELSDTAYVISLDMLSDLRRFVAFYLPEKYPENPVSGLYEWMRIVAGQGHLEAYSYWLLYDARPDEFLAWYKVNKDKYEAFEGWFLRNTYHKHLKKSVVREILTKK